MLGVQHRYTNTTSTQTHTHRYTHVHIRVCIYRYYICVCINICIYAYIHIHKCLSILVFINCVLCVRACIYLLHDHVCAYKYRSVCNRHPYNNVINLRQTWPVQLLLLLLQEQRLGSRFFLDFQSRNETMSMSLLERGDESLFKVTIWLECLQHGWF